MNINATLIGQMITFILLVLFTMKFIWPPIIKAIKDREKKIASGLDAAVRGQQALEASEKESEKILQDAKQRANHIIEQSNKLSNEIIEEAKGKAVEEGKHILSQAKTEIETQVKNAKVVLMQEVSTIAIKAASKIIEKEIDQSSHEKMLTEFLEELSVK